jgi:hypothetical protein
MRYLALLALLGCERTHDVSIRLGPDDQSVTTGFQCRRADDTFIGDIALVGDRLKFNVVVDFIDLGGGVPGCRGEELVKTCKQPGACTIAGTTRFCVPLDLPVALIGQADQKQLIALVHDQLVAQGAITTDAPNGPVLIRAVATTESCTAITPGHPFALAQVIGCAYSCPVVLDEISGPVGLSLDVLDEHCEAQVKVCAGFPP